MKTKINDYTDKKYTVAWLKEKLQDILDSLQFYEDDQLVNLASNTYWVGPEFISFGSIGFVDLESPVSEEDEEEYEVEDASSDNKYNSYKYHVKVTNKAGVIFDRGFNDLQKAKFYFDKMREAKKYDEDIVSVSIENIHENKVLAMLDKRIKDGKSQLEEALRMEKDTVAKYEEFKRIAGDGDNPESKLWQHLIDEEKEHVLELQAALKGDYASINDAATKFQQNVDGVAKLLRQKDLQENVSFAEGDQSFKTVLVETPVEKFDEILEVLKEEYKIDSHNGKNRIFVKIEE